MKISTPGKLAALSSWRNSKNAARSTPARSWIMPRASSCGTTAACAPWTTAVPGAAIARHSSVACLCNLASANPDHRARRVAAIYLGEEMKPAPKESPDEEPRKKKPSMSITPAQPAPYVGAYWSEELGVYYVFALKNGALYWTEIRRAEGSPRAKPAKELRPVGPGEFAFDSYGLQFHFRPSADGVPAAFSLDAGRT